MLGGRKSISERIEEMYKVLRLMFKTKVLYCPHSVRGELEFDRSRARADCYPREPCF